MILVRCQRCYSLTLICRYSGNISPLCQNCADELTEDRERMLQRQNTEEGDEDERSWLLTGEDPLDDPIPPLTPPPSP